MRVNVRKFYTTPEKLAETILDVAEGRRSYSPTDPLTVSRLDTPRGAFFVLDRHHRLVEAIAAGARDVAIEVNPHLPRIERTGGSYRHWVDRKVNIVDTLNALSGA